MTSAQDIISALPLLPAEDLRKIAAIASGLDPGKAAPRGSSQESDFARDLYEALSKELSKAYQLSSAPFNMMPKGLRQHFERGAETALLVNQRWFPRQTRGERMSMAQLYAKLILDYIREAGMSPHWRTLSWALGILPQIVDDAFPGYAEAGLLGKVQQLRTRTRPTPV